MYVVALYEERRKRKKMKEKGMKKVLESFVDETSGTRRKFEGNSILDSSRVNSNVELGKERYFERY